MTSTPFILSKAQTAQFRALKQSKVRKQENLFLLEGVRLCAEALQSKLKITACIVEKGFDALTLPADMDLFEANRTQFEQISDSKHPQGIICIAQIPAFAGLPEPGEGHPVLALDRIADPGNLGTIFRSALWFGVGNILLGPDCVDPFSPKAVRASMGAIAHLQLHQSPHLLETCRTWRDQGGTLAALHMEGKPLQDFSAPSDLCLIVGSEAHGIHPELLAISQPLSIPKTGAGESLNAAMATAIALYELSRKGG